MFPEVPAPGAHGFSLRRGFPLDQRDAAARIYWDAFGGKLGRVMGPDARALAFPDPLPARIIASRRWMAAGG